MKLYYPIRKYPEPFQSMFCKSGLLKPKVNQGFGENAVPFYKQMGMKGHNGIDYLAPTGLEIYSAHKGTVFKTYDKNNSSRTIGYGVWIKHEDGWWTVYYHLLDVNVKVGDVVNEDTLIGHADNTGQYTTGTHLHFGLYPKDRDRANGYDGAIDPTPFLITNNKNMRYVKSKEQEQYLLDDTLKIALNIGDEDELEVLKKRGLGNYPTEVSNSSLAEYQIYPLARKERWAELIKTLRDLSGF